MIRRVITAVITGMQVILTRDLIHPVLVPAAFKGRIQERVYHFDCLVDGGKAGRYTDDVGIVVLARQRRNFFGPAECGAYFLVLIGGHGHTVAASADDDAEIYRAVLNIGSYGVYEVGVIYAVKGIGAVVDHLIAFILKVFNDGLFVVGACVVVADGNFHCDGVMLL